MTADRQALSASPVNPIVVGRRRGALLESYHRGAVAVARADGSLVCVLGGVATPIYPRSSIKLIQALPFVESGAADGLGEEALALACASHGGEPAHVNVAASWLKSLGLEESALACGPHLPLHRPSADALIKAGSPPHRLHNNCSGKHVGFLAYANHLGADLDYDRLSHPVQKEVRAALSSLSSWDVAGEGPALDGCGAPNYALPLANLATAFARVADPSGLTATRAAAIERLRQACMAQPFYVAGTDRLCTRVMQEVPGLFVKVGAEGVYVASLPDRGLGLAMKIDDGNRDAVEALLIAVLVALGSMAHDHPLVAAVLFKPIPNTQGQPAARWDVMGEIFASAFGPRAETALTDARRNLPSIAEPRP